MTFEFLKKVIDDIVEFITLSVANLTKFIEGFKTTTDWNDEALDELL